jgi:hypothetical protein
MHLSIAQNTKNATKIFSFFHAPPFHVVSWPGTGAGGRFRACSAPFVPLFCSRRPESRSPGQDGYELPDPAIAEFLRLSMVSEKLYGSGQKEGNIDQASYI